LFGDFGPTGVGDFAGNRHCHLPIDKFSKKWIAIPGTDGDEICGVPGVVPGFDPDRINSVFVLEFFHAVCKITHNHFFTAQAKFSCNIGFFSPVIPPVLSARLIASPHCRLIASLPCWFYYDYAVNMIWAILWLQKKQMNRQTKIRYFIFRKPVCILN
jgi:hypothetical protein